MPSRNPSTGRRKSGSAQRKDRARKALCEPLFRDLQSPLELAGVEALEEWASGLMLRVGVAIGDADEDLAVRLRAIAAIVCELGKLKEKARRAEKALELRRLRLMQSRELVLDRPPFEDPVARLPWIAMALAWEAYVAATQPDWPLRQRLRRVRVFAQTGYVPCNAALARVSDAVDALDDAPGGG